MRRINAVVTISIMVLFAIHMIWGGLELAGITRGGSGLFRSLSYMMLILIAIHIIISTRLTVDTCLSCRRAGVSYLRENRIFWIRRVSGLALVLFIAFHVLIFTGHESNGAYRLNYFGKAELATQILMVISLLVHLSTNIKPLKIAFGLEDGRNVKMDVILVLCILLVLSGVAFLAYYLRWRSV